MQSNERLELNLVFKCVAKWKLLVVVKIFSLTQSCCQQRFIPNVKSRGFQTQSNLI